MASDSPVSNVNASSFSLSMRRNNNPNENQENLTQPNNGPFKLFSLTNAQSQGLAENANSKVISEQPVKRFGASALWNTRRQPFTLQSKRTNYSKTSAILQESPLDRAHTPTKSNPRQNKIIGNFNFTPHQGTLSDQQHHRRHDLTHSIPESRIGQISSATLLTSTDHNECHAQYERSSAHGSSPVQTLFALPSALPGPPNAYFDSAPPVTPARISESGTPNISKPRSISSVSPRIISGHHDADGEVEDTFTQAMKLGASQLQQYKAEVKRQRREIENLQKTLDSQSAANTMECTTLRNGLEELRKQHGEELARLRETTSLELARVKETARSELDAATEDARKAREELSQAREAANVHAQRDRSDVELARNKLEVMRELAKKAVEDGNRRYSELQDTFIELRKKHDNMRDTVQETVSELKDVRKFTDEGLKTIAPLLDNEAIQIKNRETKALVAELQSDRDNSQQVNAILRSKLHVLGSQLAEAQERVRDLESKQIVDGGKLEACTRQLAEASERLSKLSGLLDVRERDAIQTLAEAARLEEKSNNAEEKCVRLLSELHQKTEDITRLEFVREENITLSLKLEEKNRMFSVLESSHNQTSATLATAEERNQALEKHTADFKAQTDVLKTQRNTLASEKSKALSDLAMSETRIHALEMQLNTLQSEMEHSTLQLKSLASSKDGAVAALSASNERVHVLERENGALKERIRSSEERDQAIQAALQTSQSELRETQIREKLATQAARQVEKLQSSLEAANMSSKKLEISLSASQSECSILQKRFDDQAVTLHSTKEQCSDLEERLAAAETAYSTKLEASTGKYRVENAVLKEKNSALESRSHELEGRLHKLESKLMESSEECKRQREALAGAVVDSDRKLSQQEAVYCKLVEAQEERAKSAERELIAVRRICDENDARLRSLSSELEEARSATGVPDPSAELNAKLRAEQLRVEELENTVGELKLKGDTVFQRYQEGDLSDTEKAFVDLLMQRARSVHEEDLVAKGNELRRRENMIASLQKQIVTLESTLARRLRTKEPEVQNQEATGDSIINLGGWVLSSPNPACVDATNVHDADHTVQVETTAEETGVDPRTIFSNHSEVTTRQEGRGKIQEPKPLAENGAETALPEAIPKQISSTSTSISTSRRPRKNARTRKAPDPKAPPSKIDNALLRQDPCEKSGPSDPAHLPIQSSSSHLPNFSELNADVSDLSEFDDDDIPLDRHSVAQLGKHPRTVSPIESLTSEDPPRSTRRPRNTAQRQGNTRRKQSQSAQTKTRKR